MAKRTFLSQVKLVLSEPRRRADPANGYAINAINAKRPVPADGPSDPDESPAVIEPGWWADAEPPEAPPPLDDGPSAEYWGWPPLRALDA